MLETAARPTRRDADTMNAWVRDDLVRRRVPEGRELPAHFDAFLHTGPPFAVEWNDLADYSLAPSALEEAVPFLRLPDGGLVVFWYREASPAVVHIGAHGELQILAHDFDDFLRAVGERCSGLPDFDEAGQPFRVRGVTGKPNREGLEALQSQFKDWFRRHTSLREPLESPAAEALRGRVHLIAEEMIRDGRSRVYTPSSPWWLIVFRIERKGPDLSITYLDYGAWFPVPEKYKLAGEARELLELVRHKTRGHYELSVSSDGIVSIDRDRELVLVPPKR